MSAKILYISTLLLFITMCIAVYNLTVNKIIERHKKCQDEIFSRHYERLFGINHSSNIKK